MTRSRYGCLAVLLHFMVSGANAALIHGIELEERAEISKVFILLDTTAKYRIFKLPDPPRLVIDVVESKKTNASLSVHGKRISAVRHAPRPGGDYRIVFDLNQDFQYRHRVERDDAGAARVVLEIGKFAAAPRVPPPTELRDLIVVIDPGHGGRDSGAIGKSGSYEKDLVLQISQETHRFLSEQFGIDVYLTRDADEYIGLRERIKIAKDRRADVFVSIHADSLKEEYVTGSSVYILSEDGASSEAARMLAKRESADAFVGAATVSNKEAASILVDILQTATLQNSKIFARTMIDTLDEDFKVRRRIESAGFAVLKSLEIPSLLIEAGYLSNAEEEKRLSQPRYQQRLAAAIGEGVKRYLSEHAPNDSWLGHYTVDQYTVLSGDSLWRLAHRNGVSIGLIKQMSGLTSDNLQIGQQLLLPLRRNNQ